MTGHSVNGQQHLRCVRTTTNRLEEDQAPCLLVLTRTDLSLHNLKLTISKGRSSDFLRPLIDQEYEKEDRVKSGELKMGFLRCYN